MNIKEELSDFKQKVDPELEVFFDRIIADSKKNNFIIHHI